MIKLIQVDDNVYSLLAGDEKNFTVIGHKDADAKYFFKFIKQDCICMEVNTIIDESRIPGIKQIYYFSTPVAVVRGVRGMLKFILGRYGDYPRLEMKTLKAQCTQWQDSFTDDFGVTHISEIGCVL